MLRIRRSDPGTRPGQKRIIGGLQGLQDRLRGQGDAVVLGTIRNDIENKLKAPERRRLAALKRLADGMSAVQRATSTNRARLTGKRQREEELLDLVSKKKAAVEERNGKRKIASRAQTELTKKNLILMKSWARKAEASLDNAEIKFRADMNRLRGAIASKLLTAEKAVDLAEKAELLVEKAGIDAIAALERLREARETAQLRTERQLERTNERLRVLETSQPTRELIQERYVDEVSKIKDAQKKRSVDKILYGMLSRRGQRLGKAMDVAKGAEKFSLTKQRSQMIKRGKVTKSEIRRTLRREALLSGRPSPLDAATYVVSAAGPNNREVTLKRGVAIG